MIWGKSIVGKKLKGRELKPKCSHERTGCGAGIWLFLH